MKPKRMAIWGMNIRIPPKPGKIPCVSKLVKLPAGREFESKSPNQTKPRSIRSIGNSDHEKTAWKIINKTTMKVRKPQTGCVSTLSMRLVIPKAFSGFSFPIDFSRIRLISVNRINESSDCSWKGGT